MAKVKINSIQLNLLFYLSSTRFHAEVGHSSNCCLTDVKNFEVFPLQYTIFLPHVNHEDHTDNILQVHL